MTPHVTAFEQIRPGEPKKYRNLTMLPLLGEDRSAIAYLLLADATEADLASVEEVSEAGTVSELRFVNKADQPVLLLDGEELIGAKQNRIVNLTILAPARQEIVIPVTCIEQGRWDRQSHSFKNARRSHYARGRARLAEDLSAAMEMSESRHADQGAMWGDIEAKMERMKVSSATHAASEMFDHNTALIERFVENLGPMPEQRGALFAIGGAIVGCDLFDRHDTLVRVLPALVRSYALDAIDVIPGEEAPKASLGETEFLETIRAARAERHPAIGLGDDIRLRAEGLAGGGLAMADAMIHLAAFVREPGESRSPGGSETRIVRGTRRRRSRPI